MKSLAHALEYHAAEHGAQPAFTFLRDGIGPAETLTFAELAGRARALAATLVERGAAHAPVLVLCPAGLDYVVALASCFYARAIAVPAYPPTRISMARTMPRVLAICGDCRPAAALVTESVLATLRDARAIEAQLGDIALISVDSPHTASAPAGGLTLPGGEMPAILQYTSGSTASPKGVLLSHRQVLAHHELGQASGELSERDVILSWLPPYHDMGLIGALMFPMQFGIRAVLMPPESFIRNPIRWLQASQTYYASILMAPNFAFDLCVRRIPPEARAGLDLSSWRVVYNGAEPIRAETLDAFAEAFAPHGFRREAFYPCYGMAEATLIISGGRPEEPPVVRDYMADALEQHRAEAGDGRRTGKRRRLVGCGRALLDEQILIVEPERKTVLPACHVGEIWVKSRSVASGYFNRPEETEHSFRAYTSDTGEGPFLRTGDLGFFDQGELFVTGRLKDLILIRGLNHYPQDIERTVQALHPALVADAGAAFAVETPEGEQLVVVQEFDKREGADPDALLDAIAQAIRAQHDLAALEIVLIKRGSLQKTSSGKVKRRPTKAAYLLGELARVASLRAEQVSQRQERPSAPAPHTTSTTTFSRKREQLISDWLREQLATKLHLDPDAIDPAAPLARYGVDSLIAAELTEDLERFLGLELPATISYDNPTIATLARVLSGAGAAPRKRRSTPQPLSGSAGHAEDPIAIVGMACRLPGAPDLQAYWSLLQNGVDAIGEIPEERWDVKALYAPEPGTPGKMYSRHGGFLPRIDEFDAAFFGISAREAAHMDPQQRLFLEVAWEALEDAGQSPAELAGTPAGVFAGVCTSDYAILYGGDLRLIDADYGTGSSPSIVANRLSYVLDLKGPSETVDSACSSSLVALQHACQSLRNLECDLAIVGGVNAVLAPEANVYFSQVRALARDGRCKTFDERADGFVRSEGAGVIVLKRLSRALADGDRVYALVVASAVNHDGRSNGLLAPSGAAQQEVVRRALAAAAISASDVDYVEAHGVGTRVADTVELRALGELFREEARERPLLVGSVKTNLGHLEAASGVASLIKVALSLTHEEIPPHLHLRDVHPDIGLSEFPIEIPTVQKAWRRGERPRFAGVSAFGFGGTNAHVVLREAPATALPDNKVERPRHVLALSGKSGAALRAAAQRMAHRLAEPVRIPDLCFTANVGRAHFAHRLAVTGADAAELRGAIERWLAGGAEPHAHSGELRPSARAHVAFLFMEAAVEPGAARALFDGHPHVRQTLELAHETLRPHLELPLLDLLYGSGDPGTRQALLARPSHGHPALIALQSALHGLLVQWGIEAIAVYGSGVSEYAAAAASGVFSWQQALVLAARRGLLLESLVAGARQRLSIKQLRSELAQVDYLAPSVPFVSASLGRAFTLDEVPDAAHFGRHIYSTPALGAARDALIAEGCQLHFGLGPAPSVAPEALLLPELQFLPLVAPDGDDWRALLDALALLYARGGAIDFRGFDSAYARRKIALPTYPFERQRYWLEFPRRAGQPAAEGAVVEPRASHPFISRMRVRAAPQSFVQATAAAEPDEERNEKAR